MEKDLLSLEMIEEDLTALRKFWGDKVTLDSVGLEEILFNDGTIRKDFHTKEEDFDEIEVNKELAKLTEGELEERFQQEKKNALAFQDRLFRKIFFELSPIIEMGEWFDSVPTLLSEIQENIERFNTNILKLNSIMQS